MLPVLRFELGGQLHPLGFAAGQGGAGLAQLHIAQAHVVKRLDLVQDLLLVGKEGAGLLHRHVQHVCNILALVAHLQGLPVVALAAADVAGHVHIRQKMHLDLHKAVALAGLAATALDIEGEAPLAEAAHFCILRACKQIADIVKDTGIGRRIGARRTTDWALIQRDDLIHRFQPSIPSHLPGRSLLRFFSTERVLYRISLMREDFPLPDTPVTQMSFPSGISTSMFFRLFSAAPRIQSSLPFPLPALGGYGDRFCR